MARGAGSCGEEPRGSVHRGPQVHRVLTGDGSLPDRHLTLADIEDLRAYERGREAYRTRVIELKRRRRVAVGPLVTFVFENRETIRFQVQEMARVEKMISDEQIQGELDVYNPLIPNPGELSATLFVELTSEAALREWLGKLVGIERAVELRLGAHGPVTTDGQGDKATAEVIRATPEAAHEEALTRKSVTASVHYVWFSLTEAQVERFAEGPVALAVAHPAYLESATLSDATVTELLEDLRP